MIAGNSSDPSRSEPKVFRDRGIRDVAISALSHNWGKIEDGPGHMVLQHRPGPSPNPTHQSGKEACLTIPEWASLSREEAQKRVIETLDALRKQGESYLINKPRWMLIARAYGLSHAEIAVVLGMSEGAVRQAVKRAKNSPDFEGGA